MSSFVLLQVSVREEGADGGDRTEEVPEQASSRKYKDLA